MYPRAIVFVQGDVPGTSPFGSDAGAEPHSSPMSRSGGEGWMEERGVRQLADQEVSGMLWACPGLPGRAIRSSPRFAAGYLLLSLTRQGVKARSTL